MAARSSELLIKLAPPVTPAINRPMMINTIDNSISENADFFEEKVFFIFVKLILVEGKAKAKKELKALMVDGN